MRLGILTLLAMGLLLVFPISAMPSADSLTPALSTPQQAIQEHHDIDILDMIFSVIGGFGVFLLGMSFMSSGLQTVSGSKLRQMIAVATNNRILATIVGFTVTAIAQSSTVTTVMAIGFVNSGLMTLKQAIGIIIGANVGTTVTGWIMALNVGRYGLPILGITACFYLFSKKEKVKYIALAITGIGMILFGMELMKNGLKPVRSLPDFHQWFALFDAASYHYGDIVLAAVIGCILTMLVHSSAATLAITISMASSGMLNFETSIALILGQNIGTTVTAFLASLGASTNARRAAIFHVTFNVLGAMWAIIIFKYYVVMLIGILEFLGLWETLPIEGKLAASHTIFNVINTILFLPFTTKFSLYLHNIIKERKAKTNAITQLDYQLIETPFAAITQSQHEITKMARVARKMFYKLRHSFEEEIPDPREVDYILSRENDLDLVQQEITAFLTELIGGTLPMDIAEQGKDQIRIADELESVSDYIAFIVKMKLRLIDRNLCLSEGQRDEILELHDMVLQYFQRVIKIKIKAVSEGMLLDTKIMSTQISQHILKLREMHWHRIEQRKIDPLLTMAYTDIIQAYRKIKNHLKNVVDVKTTGNYEKLEE